MTNWQDNHPQNGEVAIWHNRIVRYGEAVIADLLANPFNARIHGQAQQAMLLGSLSTVGIVDTLMINVSTNHLVDGHLRMVLADRHGVETWPALWIDVSEDEEKFILATLDWITVKADTDREVLDSLLQQLQADDSAMQAVIEGDERLQDMLSEMAQEHGLTFGDVPEDAGAQLDRAEELQEQWQVSTGDLWIIPSITGDGVHKLLCGDSTNADDVNALLQGEKPLLMVTDPPYGVNYDANWRNVAAAEGKLAYAARRVSPVVNDDRADWSEAYQLFDCDVIYTWSPPGDYLILTGQAVQAAGYEIRNQIMWRKPHFPISRGHYTYQHEPCWYAVKKGSISHWIGDANASTVWEIALDKNVEGGHSTQKPLECMARPIRNHNAAIIVDPFAGSGTTAVACEQLQRQCRMIEISEKYCAVILQRMTDLGCTPERV